MEIIYPNNFIKYYDNDDEIVDVGEFEILNDSSSDNYFRSPPPSGIGSAGSPTSPPPSYIPSKNDKNVKYLTSPVTPFVGGSTLKTVSPNSIRFCLYQFTYIWQNNGRSYWAYIIRVNRRSIAGYRWAGWRWVYFGIDLRRIESFVCYRSDSYRNFYSIDTEVEINDNRDDRPPGGGHGGPIGGHGGPIGGHGGPIGGHGGPIGGHGGPIGGHGGPIGGHDGPIGGHGGPISWHGGPGGWHGGPGSWHGGPGGWHGGPGGWYGPHGPWPGYYYPPGRPPVYLPLFGGPGVIVIGGSQSYNYNNICLYQYVHIWQYNGKSYWAFLTNADRYSISGYRWIGGNWNKFTLSSDKIKGYSCS